MKRSTKEKKQKRPDAVSFYFDFKGKHMDNEKEILKIIAYENECLFEPKNSWPEYLFLKRSYERWAADEIIFRIMESPWVSACVVIEGFISKMEYFLCGTNNAAAQFIFTVAQNTAEEILSIIS